MSRRALSIAPAPEARQGNLVAGFDIGTSFGWALLSPRGDRIASGAWDLSPAKLEGGGWRLLRLRQRLLVLLDEYDIGCAAFERIDRLPRPAAATAAHVHGELRGVLRMVLEENRIPHRSYAIGEIKRHATGKGNAGKDDMISAASARWGVSFETDDEADAIWISDLVRTAVHVERNP